MPHTLSQNFSAGFFAEYFSGQSLALLQNIVALALEEDGPDLTAQGIFHNQHSVHACIHAKQDSLVTGLPLIPLIFKIYAETLPPPAGSCPDAHLDVCAWKPCVHEGSFVHAGTDIALLTGPAKDILKLERVILNFMTHLSGISNLTHTYVTALEGTGVRLLDTRKTLPGLRWAEKYAVRVGGGLNHRRNLTEMLMLKDNHIDAAGSIQEAVQTLRRTYSPCPPIEVECRTASEVKEAVTAAADRIMLDNMDVPALTICLPLIPKNIEAEISGNVSLENIRDLALAGAPHRQADFISVGKLTHSAPTADFSMRLQTGR